MNRSRSSLNSWLASVVAMAIVLVSSALGQGPDEATDATAAAEQTYEFGYGDESYPYRGTGGWDLPYYDAPHDDASQGYLHLEYLNWWLSGNALPALVTTSPVGTSPILGIPGTTVLFGGDDIDAGSRGGFRGTLGINLGHWFETDLKLEADLIVIGGDFLDSENFLATSSGDPQLGRPFFDVQAAVPDAFIVAAPGLVFPDPYTGLADPTLVLDNAELQIASESNFNAAGMIARRTWMAGNCHWIDWLAGYRYLHLEEQLGIRQFQSFSDPTDASRTATIDILDSFSTWNEFHGGELGVAGYVQCGPWSLEVLAKVALGNVHQILEIAGGTEVTRPDNPNDPIDPTVIVANSGIFAAPSNVGRYTADRFGAVPEIGITLRRTIGQCAVTVGYTVMAFPHVLRTGDQIDTAIDLLQVTPNPSATLNDSTVWLHGIDIGFEW